MKKLILSYLLSQRSQIDKNLKKKLLIGFGIFSVVSLAILVFVGYLFIQGASSLYQVAQNTLAAPQSLEQMKTQVTQQPLLNEVATKVQNVQMNSQNCIQTVLDLAALRPWLERPLLELFGQLKNSCLTQNTDSQQKSGSTDSKTQEPQQQW